MNNFTTELTRILLSNPNSLPAFEEVAKELFRQKLEESINQILIEELDALLEYPLYERNDSDNSRNGSYQREYQSVYGTLHLNIPRDRLSRFETALFEKYQRRSSNIDEKIIDMYKLGMTDSEISKLADEIYGKKYSSSTVSRITDALIRDVDSFKKRPLKKEYAVIYLDGTYMNLRRDTVAKECVHIALGVDMEGKKEILAYSIAPEESLYIWKELLLDLKQRGTEAVSLFCTDGLHGMKEAVQESFPYSRFQRCLLHVSRNIASKVRVSDRKEILNDFKDVYSKQTLEQARTQLDLFLDKWKKYQRVLDIFEKNDDLFTFYSYPESVRKSIYVSNLIESYNKKLKRSFKKKEQFPTETSMEKYLVMEFEEYNTNAGMVSLKGFRQTIRSDWFND